MLKSKMFTKFESSELKESYPIVGGKDVKSYSKNTKFNKRNLYDKVYDDGTVDHDTGHTEDTNSGGNGDNTWS